MDSSRGEKYMKKIWFRVGCEANISDEDLHELLIYSGQIEGPRNCKKAHEIMEKIVNNATLSGETYIVGKNNGGVDDYDNPENEITFLY